MNYIAYIFKNIAIAKIFHIIVADQKENEDKLKDLAQLPDSCEASADCLENQRGIFEQHNVFSPAMIDGIIKRLRSYGDKTLRADINGNQEEMLKLVEKYFHCG